MQLVDILTLYRAKGIGNKTLNRIITLCRDNKINSLSELRESEIIKPKILNDFFYSQSWESMLLESKSLYAEWESLGIQLIVFGSAEYPTQLIELDEPPAILFCKGNINLLKETKTIAVVGTRKNTNLGEIITQRTVDYFTQQRFCIVSGLALGIDSIAHSSTITQRGKTIAVLVDVLNIAPSQNSELAKQILNSGGLIISENIPNTKIFPALFVKRDRIQAGLSMAIFAIETSETGGTMHAVREANKLRRDVYVPDPLAAKYTNLSDPAITGTQMLIKENLAKGYSREHYEAITKRLIASAETFINK